jgi:hypothetical protein
MTASQVNGGPFAISWRVAMREPIMCAALGRRTVFFLPDLNSRDLVAYSTNDGSVRWRAPASGLRYRILWCDPYLVLYWQRSEGSEAYTCLTAYEEETGQQVWTHSFPQSKQNLFVPVSLGGAMLHPGTGGLAYLRDGRTGAVQNTYELPSARPHMHVLMGAETIYSLAWQGKTVEFVAIDRIEKDVLFRCGVPLDPQEDSAVILGSRALVTASEKRRAVIRDARTGAVMRELPFAYPAGGAAFHGDFLFLRTLQPEKNFPPGLYRIACNGEEIAHFGQLQERITPRVEILDGLLVVRSLERSDVYDPASLELVQSWIGPTWGAWDHFIVFDEGGRKGRRQLVRLERCAGDRLLDIKPPSRL